MPRRLQRNSRDVGEQNKEREQCLRNHREEVSRKRERSTMPNVREEGVSVPWNFTSRSFMTSMRPAPKEWSEQKPHQGRLWRGQEA